MNFHAHVYYTPENTRYVAENVASDLAKVLVENKSTGVSIGSFHDRSVGPHPQSMFAIYFDLGNFSLIVPWLMLNRKGLTVLVHPETGNDLMDHTEHPLWMGEILPLDLERL